MTAQIIKVANAATAQLAAAVKANQFPGFNFRPKRNWIHWSEELKGCTDLRVDVRATKYERSELETQESIGYQCSIEIYIRQELGEQHRGQDREFRVEVIDELVLLTEQIHELFINEPRPATFPDVVWRNSKILDVARVPNLQRGQYFGCVRVTYDAPKDLAA